MNNLTTERRRVYVLRLWQAESPDLSWRASLEDPRTGERVGFENLERLFIYLMEVVERDSTKERGGSQ